MSGLRVVCRNLENEMGKGSRKNRQGGDGNGNGKNVYLIMNNAGKKIKKRQRIG